MTARTLYLFPDTNLFIQCHPLGEIDWSEWSNFNEVHLLVCRPVQREIDNQKNRGSDRVGRRARRASSLFRKIILGHQDYQLIRDSEPPVKLLIESSLLPSPELADRLDYTKPDDEFVGCLHAFLIQNLDADARLLTHDTGPMGSAKMLGLSFIAIPDEWLTPPENNEEEKKINRLERDLARLKKAEPDFCITCQNGEGDEIDKLEFEHLIYEQLSEDNVSEFVASLKSRFLLTTDFGSREPAERELKPRTFQFSGMKNIYTPATEDQITEYTETKYPGWLEECETLFRNLHLSMQRTIRAPAFSFVVSNEGTRPGKDVLITIQANGNFQILPPVRKDDDNDQEEGNAEKKIELPCPPTPPQGKWSVGFGGHNTGALTAMGALRALQKSAFPFGASDSLFGLGSAHRFAPLSHRVPSHDPNGFYYKPNFPTRPRESFSLECEQWRHGIEDVFFDGHIHFDRSIDEIRGALECRIHAENLASHAIKTIPVRITITKTGTREYAENLLNDMINRAG